LKTSFLSPGKPWNLVFTSPGKRYCNVCTNPESKNVLLVLFVGARPCKLDELLGANLVQSIPEGFLYDILTIL